MKMQSGNGKCKRKGPGVGGKKNRETSEVRRETGKGSNREAVAENSKEVAVEESKPRGC